MSDEIKDLGISEDLISSLDEIKEIPLEEEDVIGSLKKQYGQSPESVYKILPRSYSENDLKLISERFYHSWVLSSRKFIKFYCTLNDYIQRWSRKINSPAKEFQYGPEFRPFVYSFALSTNMGVFTPICSDIAYAEECTIQAAIGLGFLNSDSYKVLLASYDKDALEIILNNAIYFKRIRDKKTLEEHQTQIQKSLTQRNIPYKRKIQWLNEIRQRLMGLDL